MLIYNDHGIKYGGNFQDHTVDIGLDIEVQVVHYNKQVIIHMDVTCESYGAIVLGILHGGSYNLKDFG